MGISLKPIATKVAKIFKTKSASTVSNVVEKTVAKTNELASDVFQGKFSIVPTKDKNDIQTFINLFCDAIIPKPSPFAPKWARKLIEMDRFLVKNAMKPAISKGKLEVVKNSEGQIIGGFSTYIKSSKTLYIPNIVLDNSLRNSKDGLKLLKQIAQKIKLEAVTNGQKTIACHSVPDKHVRRLYQKMGFVETGKMGMEAKTEDFGKGLID